MSIVADVVIPRYTPAGTQFSGEHVLQVLSPMLVGDIPSGTDRGEHTPAVLTTETTAPISTESKREGITMVVVIHGTSEEGHQRPTNLIRLCCCTVLVRIGRFGSTEFGDTVVL